MTSTVATKTPEPLILERTYEASVLELWELWTTKDGFESWWGPKGFRVDVHEIDPREGGSLRYDMIAVGEDEIAFMKQSGSPLSHATAGTFTRVSPHTALSITHLIDFLPGVEPYENTIAVEFEPQGAMVRMVIQVQPHHDEHWTRMASMGMQSQLTKVPDALRARRSD